MKSREIRAILILNFLSIYLLFIFLDSSFSSDYIPYSNRFKDSGWYLANDFRYFFDGIHFLLSDLPINYPTYLKFWFTINYLFFAYLIFESFNIFDYEKKYLKLILIFIFFFNFIFSFEFLTIRLRSGTSMLLMFASFIFFYKNQYKASFIFFLCSAFTHELITVIFFYFTFFLVFLFKIKMINKYLELIILVTTTILIFFTIEYINKNGLRGSVELKPLDYYRILLYCVFPIFWIFYISKKNNNFLICRSQNFLEIFLKTFFLFLVGIVITAMTDARLYIGEDILRTFTVPSFIMFFLLFRKKYIVEILILNFYVLSINYFLFLKNYVYLLE